MVETGSYLLENNPCLVEACTSIHKFLENDEIKSDERCSDPAMVRWVESNIEIGVLPNSHFLHIPSYWIQVKKFNKIDEKRHFGLAFSI